MALFWFRFLSYPAAWMKSFPVNTVGAAIFFICRQFNSFYFLFTVNGTTLGQLLRNDLQIIAHSGAFVIIAIAVSSCRNESLNTIFEWSPRHSSQNRQFQPKIIDKTLKSAVYHQSEILFVMNTHNFPWGYQMSNPLHHLFVFTLVRNIEIRKKWKMSQP